METFLYQAFGLTIRSDIQCPELIPGNANPDVCIRRTKIPDIFVEHEELEHFWRATPEYFYFSIHTVGKYLVTAGNTVLVEQHPKASDADLRVFMLGTCLGVLLHQRGILPIHGSGIVVDDSGVVFSGEIGAGKSTLASSFMQRGWKIIADDVCAIRFDTQDQPIIQPGYAQVKLCRDTAVHLGISVNDHDRVSSYSDKIRLSTIDFMQQETVSLSILYFLAKHEREDISIRELSGRNKFFSIGENTYRKSLINDLARGQVHFENCTKLSGKARAFQVLRPEGGVLNSDLTDCVETHLQRLL